MAAVGDDGVSLAELMAPLDSASWEMDEGWGLDSA